MKLISANPATKRKFHAHPCRLQLPHLARLPNSLHGGQNIRFCIRRCKRQRLRSQRRRRDDGGGDSVTPSSPIRIQCAGILWGRCYAGSAKHVTSRYTYRDTANTNAPLMHRAAWIHNRCQASRRRDGAPARVKFPRFIANVCTPRKCIELFVFKR